MSSRKPPAGTKRPSKAPQPAPSLHGADLQSIGVQGLFPWTKKVKIGEKMVGAMWKAIVPQGLPCWFKQHCEGIYKALQPSFWRIGFHHFGPEDLRLGSLHSQKAQQLAVDHAVPKSMGWFARFVMEPLRTQSCDSAPRRWDFSPHLRHHWINKIMGGCEGNASMSFHELPPSVVFVTRWAVDWIGRNDEIFRFQHDEALGTCRTTALWRLECIQHFANWTKRFCHVNKHGDWKNDPHYPIIDDMSICRPV